MNLYFDICDRRWYNVLQSDKAECLGCLEVAMDFSVSTTLEGNEKQCFKSVSFASPSLSDVSSISEIGRKKNSTRRSIIYASKCCCFPDVLAQYILVGRVPAHDRKVNG